MVDNPEIDRNFTITHQASRVTTSRQSEGSQSGEAGSRKGTSLDGDDAGAYLRER